MGAQRDSGKRKGRSSQKTVKSDKSKPASRSHQPGSRTQTKNSLTRAQWWENNKFSFPPALTGGTERARDALARKTAPFPSGTGVIEAYIRTCKELIFDVDDGRPVFVTIGPVLNVKTMHLEMGPVLEITSPPEQDAWNDAKEILAAAILESVPVLANTPEAEQRLLECYRDLMQNGFDVELEKKPPTRVRLTRHAQEVTMNPSFPSLTEYWSPAEIKIVRQRVEQELRDAHRALASARASIERLSELLEKPRTERELQECITDNPSLFGPDYSRVLPHHSFGGEFVTDYALERYTGVIDLIEIEPSTFPLFNRNGDPSKHLIHAEQQVLDWLQWIEENGAYARTKLPRLFHPMGYVVIGRKSSLTPKTERSLTQRNQLHRGAIEILTYDDVLERARSALKFLAGI